MEEVQGELEADGLHVGLLEGRGDVHVHLEKVAHHTTLLSLLNLELGEQLHKPLKGLLVPVDPVKVHL